MSLVLTLPATAAAILSIGAPWHPCRPSSVAIAGGVATLTADGLAALYWRPMVLALGGSAADAAPVPEHDYLTTTAGEILTDSAGLPLWT